MTEVNPRAAVFGRVLAGASEYTMHMVDHDLRQRRERALGPAYRLFYERPLHLVRGEGVWLYDEDERRYLDCYNNVAAVGHCHPHVVAALTEQAATLNTHTRYLHENVVRYAERLAATMPAGLDVCMFTCTGSEANDLAYRMARAVTGNDGAVILENAYHGTSNAVFDFSPEEYPAAERPRHVETVAAPNRFRDAPHQDPRDFGRDCGQAVAGAAEALAGRGHPPAMFISDNIFSSNGVLTPPPEFLQTAYGCIRDAGGLTVADEVQSGLCRLGEHTWAFEDSGVVPDIVTLGKPLGNGHPLAAVVTTRAVAEAFSRKYSYFNTFGGNPVSTAVGSAVLDVIENENILHHVRETGASLQQGLRELQSRFDLIADVRGKGLFFGLELVRDRDSLEPAAEEAARIREDMRERGVLLGLTGPLGNVIKIRPPMVFSSDNSAFLLENLEQTFQCTA